MHEVLTACIARDALEKFRIHERVAMDAYEARPELFFQRLQGVLDEILALAMLDRGVLLVRDETQHVVERDELESVAPARTDVRAPRRLLLRARHLLQLRARETTRLRERREQLLGANRLE